MTLRTVSCSTGLAVRVASDGGFWAETAVSAKNKKHAAMVSRDVFTSNLVELTGIKILDALEGSSVALHFLGIALLRGRGCDVLVGWRASISE